MPHSAWFPPPRATAWRAAALGQMALPPLVALMLPPRGTLAIQEAIPELKLMTLRWGYAAALAVVGALWLVSPATGRRAPGQGIRRRLAEPDGPALLLLTALFAWWALALIASPHRSLAWRLDATFLFPVALCLVVTAGRAPLDGGRFLAAAVATGVLIALGVLAQALGINPFAFAYDIDALRVEGRGRLVATLGNPEYVGGYLAATAAGALVASLLLLGRPSRRARRFGGVAVLAAAILLVGLIATGTRSALLALVSGVLVGAHHLRLPWGRFVRSPVTFGACALLLVAVIAFSFPNPLNRRFVNYAQRLGELLDAQSPSVVERLLAYTAGNAMIAEHPLLGVGPGMFSANYYPTLRALEREDRAAGVRQLITRSSEKGAGDAHNDYVQFGAELGLPGLVLLLGLAVALLVRGGGGPARPRSLDPALRGALAALLTSSLFSFPLQTPGRAALFWGLVAASLAERRRPAPPTS